MRRRKRRETDPPAVGGHEETDVQELFSRTVRTYDFLNHLFSFGIDKAWRRRLVELASVAAGGTVADLCSGTADVAIAFAAGRADVRVTGVDFSQAMLDRARRKLLRRGFGDRVELVRADALRLPFGDATFDAATIAFGLRNLRDRSAGIAEMARVVRPGGRVLILEFSPPADTGFGRLYRWYLRSVMPAIGGGISGYRPAFGYLFESIAGFLSPGEVVEVMRSAGLQEISVRRLSGGIAYIHCGTKHGVDPRGRRAALG